MKSTGRILRRAFSKVNHSKRIYYSSAPETVVSSVEGIKVDNLYDNEFPEYDPTPYDGGLDLALTYGKPLPASDATCYPPLPCDPNSSTLKGFSYGSIPSPYGKEGADHGLPQSGRVPPRSSDGEKPPAYDGSGNSPSDPNPNPNYGNGCWEGGILPYGNGHDYGCDHSDNNELVVPYQGEEESYGWEIQAVDDYCPNYADPSVDPLFSWLFASQGDENNYHPYDADYQNCGNHRNGTVEYLFGYWNPYGESRDEIHSYGNPIYGYEKHRPGESRYGQDKSSALSLFQEPMYYEDYQEKERFQEPIYYEDYQEEKRFQEPIYYEDYQEEERFQEPIYYEDYQEEERFQEPIYYEDYQEEEHTQSKYVIHYERHGHEQHNYGQEEYSNELWFQKPSYYKPHQEEVYTGPKYADDSYIQNGGDFHYQWHKYFNYDK